MKNISTNTRIKDIASKVGVSTGTVDRVIHNRGHVAPDVQKRVLRMLKEMNYEPNLIARALGSNKPYNIAALVPNPAHDPYWAGPNEGIAKAGEIAKQYGVSIQQYAFNPYDIESYIAQATKLTEARPNGIIIAPMFNKETIPFFMVWRAENTPFVQVNTQITESGALSYVGQDAYQSGLLAAGIIHYGQSNPCSILIVHLDEEVNSAPHLVDKAQGFKDYFVKNKISEQYPILSIEIKEADLSAFDDKLGKLIKETPDLRGMYVTNSKVHEIADYLERKNINNIKLVGYDLLPQNIRCLNKGYISFLINQNPKGQGYWAINQLVDHIVFKKTVPLVKHLPLDIITKENVIYYTNDDVVYQQHALIIT